MMIDEIDLYLHPHWQKHVLQDLAQAFPMMKKSRVLWQNNTEFEQILPLEQFFKYHFSSATSEKKEEGRPLMKIFNYPKGHTHKKNYKSTI